MKKILLIAAALFVTAAYAQAGGKKQQSVKIDVEKSKTSWLGKKLTGEHTGEIKLTTAEVTIADNQLTAGNFEFDMNSMTCTDITDQTSNGYLIGHLKGDDFFATAKFPTANFVITSTKLSADGKTVDITGKLTIKGVTKEITFPASVKVNEKAFVAIAKIEVNRVDFGITYKSASVFSDLGDKYIDDKFWLNVNLVATR